MTLTELLESGELEGYLPEAPTGGLISGAEIDRQVAATAAWSTAPSGSPASPTGPSPSARSAVRRTSSDPPHHHHAEPGRPSPGTCRKEPIHGPQRSTRQGTRRRPQRPHHLRRRH